MSYAFPRIKVSIQGHMTAAQEWSVGFNCAAPAGTPSQADLNDWIANLATQMNVSGFWDDFIGQNDGNGTLDGLVCYYYPSGSDAAARQAVGALTPRNFGSSTNRLPLQTALVATLLTGIPGRSGRGRMYWPMTAAPLVSGETTTTVSGHFSLLTGTILTLPGAATLGGTATVAIVASKTGAHPVTSVYVDTRADIQRRRADKLSTGTRSTTTLPVT